MKKTMMFLGVLSLGLAHAQQEFEGKVGVNTETPSATLNVKSKTGTDGTTKNLELVNAQDQNILKVFDNGNAVLGYSGTFDFFKDFTAAGVTGHLGARSYWAEAGNEEGPYLHMQNSTKTANGSIWRMYNFGNSMGQGLAFTQYNNELKNAKTVMILKDDGNVGIGTNFPKGKLHVYGSSVFEPTTQTDAVWVLSNPRVRGASGLIHTQIRPDRATNKNAGFKEYTIGTGTVENAEYRLGFLPELNNVTNHISLLVVNGATGNVGIGFLDTDHPSYKLHIKAEADPLKLEGLQAATGTNVQNLVVENGVVKVSAGTIKVANSTDDTCDGAKAGTIRFVAGTKKFQGCTGTEWKDLHN